MALARQVVEAFVMMRFALEYAGSGADANENCVTRYQRCRRWPRSSCLRAAADITQVAAVEQVNGSGLLVER
jgi:hypothetical protein